MNLFNFYTLYMNLKSINDLSLVKTMNKFSLIKNINNVTHVKSTHILSLVETFPNKRRN